MKKSTLILSCLLMASGVASAQTDAEPGTAPDDVVTRLTLSLTSGAEEHYNLIDTPEVTFAGDSLVIVSAKAEATYGRDEVERFHFTKGPASQLLPVAPGADGHYSVSYTGSVLTLAGGGVTHATVINPSGMAVKEAGADAGGVITIDLSGLTPGVYLVNVKGHRSLKIIK